jgi:hypothetical protein
MLVTVTFVTAEPPSNPKVKGTEAPLDPTTVAVPAKT